MEEKDLVRFVNEKVADYKKIRGGITFVATIPRSVVGKLKRYSLTKWANTLSSSKTLHDK